MVILLNFLIAQVSQSYDNIIGQEEKHVYLMRGDLNLENMPMLDFFSKESPFSSGSVFYLRTPHPGMNSDDQYSGFVKTIKNTIALSERKMEELHAKTS